MDAQCTLSIVMSAGQTPHELERASRHLRELLQEASVEILIPRLDPPPVGSKAGELLSVGTLTLAVVTAAIPRLISALKEWLSAREARKLELKLPGGRVLKMTGPISASEVERLVLQLTKTVKESK